MDSCVNGVDKEESPRFCVTVMSVDVAMAVELQISVPGGLGPMRHMRVSSTCMRTELELVVYTKDMSVAWMKKKRLAGCGDCFGGIRRYSPQLSHVSTFAGAEPTQ